MAGPTVYTDVAEDFDFSSGGQLFAGKKFWVAQRVPSRIRLCDNIKANGGEIVLLEKKADYRIVDHYRRDCPPGSISYEFVEKSIEEGKLRDPENHRAGPPLGEPREPGATHQPVKSGRAAYTAEEDRLLYKWVRDCAAEGGLASGNEIYKQLEAKYPRHTWQSWRDRYLKQLKNRPPSAFNIPDNAPPSPPSDQSNGRLAPGSPSSKPAKQPTSQPEQTPAATTVSPKDKTRTKYDYSVNELEAMFSTDDWLELYAFVDLIDNLAGQERYESSWAEWAEDQGKQTAEQWRQYYEKIVRPQWQSDPPSKRAHIKKKVERTHNGDSSSQAEPTSEQQHLEPEEPKEQTEVPALVVLEGETVVERPSAPEEEQFEELIQAERSNRVPPAYKLYARERKSDTWNAQPSWDYTDLHRFLLTEWHTLSAKQKAPYIAMDRANTNHASDGLKDTVKFSSEFKTSPSTARPESPVFYKDLQEKYMKRIREDGDVEEQEEQLGLSRPTKRQKSASAMPTQDNTEQRPELVGTLNEPVEISSAESSLATSQSEGVQELTEDEGEPEPVEDLLDTPDDDVTMVEHDEQEAEYEAQSSIESDEFLDIAKLPPPPLGYEALSDDELPADSPTPRANRQEASNFDTQAILSSPTQDTKDRVSRPQGYTYDRLQQEQRSSSPAQQPPSDASTTRSLQEFRRYSQLPPQQRTSSSHSPAPSSTSSTNSGDPDPPLEAEELNEFFDEQHEQGFPDEQIAKALRRTRLRPELAVKVLDALRLGQPLPFERGIWSVEDDAAVESNDGLELAKLEKKHSLDGWGGITERMLFLEANRSL